MFRYSIFSCWNIFKVAQAQRPFPEQQKDDEERTKRRVMTTQSTLIILQYNVRNEKNETMIFFLINSRIEDYDLLIIQKFYRNVCVFTSYNSFNIDLHLLY
jgi:hypothetical protein